MTVSRKFRIAGLALLACCAVSALGPTQSQAGEFTAGEFPATITGQQVGAHFFTTELGVMICNVGFHGVLEEAAETLTITPKFTGCTVAGIETDVSNNGCDFRFRAGNTLQEHEVSGSLDIVCPEGAAIDFGVTSMMGCHLTVPAQNGLGAVKYTDQTMPNDADFDFNIEGMVYKLDAGCPAAGVHGNGEYFGTSTVKADHGMFGTGFGVH
jgi:hypothetical protein